MSAISLTDVTVTFGGGLLRRQAPFTALRGVTLSVAPGETHGLVGESGSGKTTLGRVVLGLQGMEAGRAEVAGAAPDALPRGLRRSFRRRVQCVFQDSAASLDPRLTIGRSVREGLDIHRLGSVEAREEAVREMLLRVGLRRDHAERYPHELSGGQRQRVNIARALVLRPEVLVADEPVSALDVSVQAQVLDLLADLQAEMGLTMLFISHDLGVVREICRSVSVMTEGQIVESGPAEQIFAAPRHGYTQALLAAI
ncbi:ATP-binding cassette domain-containing protein [Pseudooceanicola sp. 200-1SW]|uniref:ATP-binding cassette domain-containing protein n=1 Tax=Pseudooceanicola sp. 200-1SW TaxID=3425949 RepID=UPI003D7F6913